MLQTRGMRTSRLGHRAVEVTELGLGGGPLGGLFAPLDDDAAAETLAAAWDGGIRYFDRVVPQEPAGRRDEYFEVPATHGRVWDFSRDGIRRSPSCCSGHTASPMSARRTA